MANPKILYDNIFDTGVTASTTATGFAVENISDWRPYTWWQPTALPATLTKDYGSAKSVDYFMVYGHDLFTQGATIELRGSTDNFAASDVLVQSVTPTSDKAIIKTFTAASYRYWRVRVTGTTMPSLAIVAAGAALDMTVGIQQGFDPVGRTVEGAMNRSASGHPLGLVYKYEKFEQSVEFMFLKWAFLRGAWLTAWNAHLRSSPFGFAWDTDLYDEVFLVTSGGEFRTPHSVGEYATMTLKLTGVFE